MRLVLKTLTGDRYELTVNEWDTVEVMKHKLNGLLRSPAKKHHILYNNVLLDNLRSLESYDLMDNDTLYLLSHYSNKYSPLIITLQKTDNPDDILTIVPAESNDGYSGMFAQPSLSNGHIFHLESQEMLPYIANFFAAIQYDTAGCDCVQIDCPAYPSVILERSNVSNYLPILLDQLRNLKSEWPVEFLRSSA